MAHWHTEEEEQALADFRAHNRKVAQLKQELWEFKQIQCGHGDQITSWALQMIKSIEHELHQLES